jgi:hypothetical protein
MGQLKPFTLYVRFLGDLMEALGDEGSPFDDMEEIPQQDLAMLLPEFVANAFSKWQERQLIAEKKRRLLHSPPPLQWNSWSTISVTATETMRSRAEMACKGKGLDVSPCVSYDLVLPLHTRSPGSDNQPFGSFANPLYAVFITSDVREASLLLTRGRDIVFSGSIAERNTSVIIIPFRASIGLLADLVCDLNSEAYILGTNVHYIRSNLMLFDRMPDDYLTGMFGKNWAQCTPLSGSTLGSWRSGEPLSFEEQFVIRIKQCAKSLNDIFLQNTGNGGTANPQILKLVADAVNPYKPDYSGFEIGSTPCLKTLIDLTPKISAITLEKKTLKQLEKCKNAGGSYAETNCNPPSFREIIDMVVSPGINAILSSAGLSHRKTPQYFLSLFFEFIASTMAALKKTGNNFYVTNPSSPLCSEFSIVATQSCPASSAPAVAYNNSRQDNRNMTCVGAINADACSDANGVQSTICSEQSIESSVSTALTVTEAAPGLPSGACPLWNIPVTRSVSPRSMFREEKEQDSSSICSASRSVSSLGPSAANNPIASSAAVVGSTDCERKKRKIDCTADISTDSFSNTHIESTFDSMFGDEKEQAPASIDSSSSTSVPAVVASLSHPDVPAYDNQEDAYSSTIFSLADSLHTQSMTSEHFPMNPWASLAEISESTLRPSILVSPQAVGPTDCERKKRKIDCTVDISTDSFSNTYIESTLDSMFSDEKEQAPASIDSSSSTSVLAADASLSHPDVPAYDNQEDEYSSTADSLHTQSITSEHSPMNPWASLAEINGSPLRPSVRFSPQAVTVPESTSSSIQPLYFWLADGSDVEPQDVMANGPFPLAAESHISLSAESAGIYLTRDNNSDANGETLSISWDALGSYLEMKADLNILTGTAQKPLLQKVPFDSNDDATSGWRRNSA